MTVPNIDYPPPKPGEPPLYRAARLGDADAIRSLVEQGADINAGFDIIQNTGPRQCLATPLMVAAGSGEGASAGTVSLLLELGADPKIVADNQSAATLASKGLRWGSKPGGDADRLRLLLQAGSPLPTDPEDSNRLLCDTAATGDPERLRILLENGLDPKGHFDPEAARKRNIAMMEYMTECRSNEPDPLAEYFDEDDPAMADVMSEINANMRDLEEQSFERYSAAPSSFEIPLFRAAESGNAECVRMLLDAGADAQTRDNAKRTAMYEASTLGVIQELMKAGVPLEDADEFECSPLTNALSLGEEGLPRIRALIEAGADVNATHDHGYTIFMSAVGSARTPEVLKLLVASGADPHAVSERGYNAFHAAIDVNFEANAEESVRETLTYLKELGVNIEHRNNSDQTPLARAIDDGTGIEVTVLCELGANPNAVCRKYECGQDECAPISLPLLFHAACGYVVHKDVKTEALLKAGADPLAEDNEGFAPILRVVALLCAEAPDYAMSYKNFFSGLHDLRIGVEPTPTTREEFVAAAMPVLSDYIEKFAAAIPIGSKSEYATEARAENLRCITLLCAYEGWSRRELLRRAEG